MPACCAWSGVAKRTGAPSYVTSPSSGWYTPVRTLMRVDLPAPFSPMSACTSPARAVKSTEDSAFTPGKVFDRPVTDNMSEGLAQVGLGVVLGVRAVLDDDVLGDLLA